MQFIPPQPKKRLQDFVGAFPLIRPIPAHTIQQPHKPPIHRLRHVGWHTVKRRTSSDTRYHRHAGHCTSQRSRPIIIRYIRGGSGAPPVMDLCQTVQHTADHANPAASAPTVCGSLASSAPDAPAEGSASPPVQGQPGGGLAPVSSQWRGGRRRGTIDGYRRVSFRAFAR